jgi:hypothetical protein
LALASGDEERMRRGLKSNIVPDDNKLGFQ